MVSRKDIKSAGNAAGTDKVLHHAYERFYADFLAGFSGIGSILEIGYGDGKSVGFWKSLYPSAFLYVIDRDVELEGEGFKVLKCDQSLKNDLFELSSYLQEVDISVIVDDGSHIPEHQLQTFNQLFGVLRPGGVYIIEDTECSYWQNGDNYGYETRYGINSQDSLVNKFSKVPHWINREFLSYSDKYRHEELMKVSGFNPTVLDTVASVTFAHNCIAVFKGLVGDEQYTSRQYRFESFTQPLP
jgi:hypothetical protein